MCIGRCAAATIASALLFVLVASSESLRCGKRQVASFLIHNGDKSQDGYWPWHAVLYHKTQESRSYVCGGSIIDQNTILTAAHCLMTDGKQISMERLTVQVGRNRLWNCNNWIQQHDPYELIVHPKYNVRRVGYDIAIIKLSSDISYTDYVQPICLWNRDDAEDKIVGTLATVIGFNLHESNTVSESLREARVPVVSLIQCIESNPELTTQLTSRMICAGNRDGIGPCNGDSGGGLFFDFDDVWYIRGVVSFTPPQENSHKCDLEQYTVFTDIAKYLEWIQLNLEWSAATIASVVLLVLVVSSESQSCGKRKVASFLIHNGDVSKDGFWPWHAVLYHKTRHSTAYACGGSIIDQNTILTAAHCLVIDGRKIALERLTVQVGRSRLWKFDSRIQEHDAYELIVPSNYNAYSVGNDIGLVKLSSDISYTDYVQPICLWDRGTAEHEIVGSWGTVIGFGLDESDMVSQSLREARVPVVSLIQCIESNPELLGPKVTSRMICAGNRDGIGPCNGDSGGGLFFAFDDVWYIRGMVSFTKPREDSNKCDLKQYTVFTDVAKYLDWIQSHTRGKSELSATSADERDLKIGLLPVSSCGYNPYADREEELKPLEFGYPWMGTLQYYDNASSIFRYSIVTLISDRYVLSTASIIDFAHKIGWTMLHVTLGEDDVNNRTHCGKVNGERVCAPEQKLDIEKVIMHEEFREVDGNEVNNIALIRLLDRADSSQPNVKPICLPLTAKLRNEMLNEYVVTTLNYNLIRKIVTFFDRNECRKQWIQYAPQLLSDQICVSVEKDSAMQDANCAPFKLGSPMQAVQQVLGKQRYVLHGINLIYNTKCTNSDSNVFVPPISGAFGRTSADITAGVGATVVLRIRHGLGRRGRVLLVVVRGRRPLIDRHRVPTGSDGSSAGGASRASGRFVFREQPTETLVVDQVACIEKPTEPSGTAGTTCRRSDAEPLVDVRTDLLLDRVRDRILDTAQNAAEETTTGRRSRRFARWHDDVSTGPVEVSSTSSATPVRRAASSTASIVRTTASAVATAASIASVTVAGVVIRRQGRIQTGSGCRRTGWGGCCWLAERFVRIETECAEHVVIAATVSGASCRSGRAVV
uniref:Peptidase S1 domain-containing protein n=1 Tax=Anopheles dirus TaxID=7168 RepID=A0A182N984_9DIPT